MKKSGILMPAASSSIPYRGRRDGCRSLPFYSAFKRKWCEDLAESFPMNPVGYGNSPYQPYSSCAGDEILYQPGCSV